MLEYPGTVTVCVTVAQEVSELRMLEVKDETLATLDMPVGKVNPVPQVVVVGYGTPVPWPTDER